ncbi:flagellar protein FliT [Virgibacillus sp. DJP39]|uniref:flagellar protein FliT n=1 Tax=Virgibacillus sp. DJP39 TaxID=3409790 RepID=UPI003BB718AC
MSSLEELYEITIELENVLKQTVSSKNRESVIEKINFLIEKRGSLMNSIKPPFTEDEKLMGRKLVNMNEVIQTEMTEVLSNLKTEMKQIKKQKKSNQNYVNPYKNVKTMDGMFMDSKK